jgi:hypothetical protein
MENECRSIRNEPIRKACRSGRQLFLREIPRLMLLARDDDAGRIVNFLARIGKAPASPRPLQQPELCTLGTHSDCVLNERISIVS